MPKNDIKIAQLKYSLLVLTLRCLAKIDLHVKLKT